MIPNQCKQNGLRKKHFFLTVQDDQSHSSSKPFHFVDNHMALKFCINKINVRVRKKKRKICYRFR